ncbi:Phenylalanyl-tRNA synthetase alpha chain [Candidatus Syntrophocurvum alkaliphilum]|uniref:Phenylalanine--tRNA ligase alpha subunit n=1 Tax=Candidatus Syntrophocurvum alkaliphilum TaxID=2293317 RepID=A0A6I6DEU9_9FIRM|nr:phenylalanine--tRNA ligase subunit alpha [Candidatus Syntrophocurvum alkaliphilum]QGT99716.1 Phenylalanyl-tRNA synthetase alpha chain [Candidatus Syntrophocurvum alkaliphilum]
MLEKLKEIESSVVNRIRQADKLDVLNEIKVKILGRKGEITLLLRGLKDLSPEERAQVGKSANDVKAKLEGLLDKRAKELENKQLEERLLKEKIDVTLPGVPVASGRIHPVTKVTNEIKDIFISMGFSVAEGPEIELDYYNFEALNVPKDHPARDMQDTFYISEDVLLRTHTSPVQVRTMEKLAPEVPVKIIVPGKVYRKDDDATHSPMFNQIEGLLIDERVTFANLKATLMLFAQKVFGDDVRVRFRPSFFPFTEPSAEMDISCVMCKGDGCRVCSQTGWLEILGAGIVNPRVLKYGGYDPDMVTGFAFGLGIERIAMLKYGINDLRLFYDNDKRFLTQF